MLSPATRFPGPELLMDSANKLCPAHGGHSQQPVQLHRTQNATSHRNLSLLTRPRRREEQFAFAVCLTTQEALDEAIKKLRSLFWENDAIAAMWLLYELHGTFDSKKHLSRGKGLDWSGNRNKWECWNHSSHLYSKLPGEEGRTVKHSARLSDTRKPYCLNRWENLFTLGIIFSLC